MQTVPPELLVLDTGGADGANGRKASNWRLAVWGKSVAGSSSLFGLSVTCVERRRCIVGCRARMAVRLKSSFDPPELMGIDESTLVVQPSRCHLLMYFCTFQSHGRADDCIRDACTKHSTKHSTVEQRARGDYTKDADNMAQHGLV